MDEDLEQFIRDQKVKLAQERCSMQQQDPPYMEMRRGHDPTMKENIPPPAQQKDNGSVSLPLGVEYDQKKQRLQHELRMDYRRHMAQRSKIEPAGGASHTLSQRREVKETSPRLPSRRDASTLTERSRRPDEDEEEEEEEELWRDRRAHRPPQRSTRDHPEMGGAKAGRRSRALTNKDEAEFTTGLLIGRNETDSAVQRRKDRYRMELQEQIAEQRRNRKREKDLELRVAATGATDPEKQPDRIKQFGLSRRRIQRASDPASPQQREPALPGQSRPPDQLLPPEQPRPAFQSPLLDCVCCELCPHSHTPRLQLLVPHPPSSVPDTCRSVYEGPYHHHQYYNTTYRPPPADHQRQPPEPHRIPPDHHRPPPDPSLLYFGQLPMSYLTVPPGGGVSSQLGHHSPQSHHEPSIRVDSVTEPVLHAFPSENKSSRTSLISYKDALKQQEASSKGSSELYKQIEERAERKRQEKEQADRYDAQLEEDMRRHEPWGRGGGGAPLRDSTGNLITDLKQMHRLNEEAYSKPEQYRTRISRMTREEPRIDPNDRVSGFAHVQMPHFGRGNVFSSPPTAQHVQEQDSYKTYLKQQIEEKRLQASEERERARLEEEKEERRLEEQRARIQKEFLEEQEKKKRKEMEQKAKNEELVRLAEERRRDEQRVRRDEEDKENTALRREYERERQARLEELHREPSPPIPTLQRRHGARHTPRPPSAHSLSGQPPSTHSPRPPSTRLPSTHTSPRPPPSSTHSQLSSAPLSERCLSGLQSPPVPARRNQLRAAEDNRGVFSELSALRRQLYSEQKRLEEWEEHDPLMDRRRDRPLVDVFDRARLKLQAPVRRPSSKHTEPLNLMNIHTSLQLNDGCELPSGEEEVGVTRRRRRGDSSLRTAHSDYVDLSPLHYLRTTDLLESESAFIEPLGPEPSQLSARERRRNRQTQQQQQPIGQADIFTVQSEREAGGKERTRRFQALGRQGPASRSDDDDDEGDFASLPISPRGGHAPNPHSSTETLATDPWMQVGGLSRREEGLRARDSVPQDWDT